MTQQQRDVLRLALRVMGNSTRMNHSYNPNVAFDQMNGIIRCAIWADALTDDLREVDRAMAHLFGISYARLEADNV